MKCQYRLSIVEISIKYRHFCENVDIYKILKRICLNSIIAKNTKNIDIDIDMVILENININMVIVENSDIDMNFLENIDINKGVFAKCCID